SEGCNPLVLLRYFVFYSYYSTFDLPRATTFGAFLKKVCTAVWTRSQSLYRTTTLRMQSLAL
ncbi:MAG: hypothetical protein RR475_12550, partial [Clostridia bacterium]